MLDVEELLIDLTTTTFNSDILSNQQNADRLPS